jgi:hypothetical protein
MKKTLGLLAATLLVALPAMAQEAPTAPAYNCDFQPSCEVAPGIYGKMSSPVQSKFNLSIGGFVKLDYAYNSLKLGAALLPGAPGGGLPAVGTTAANQDESILTARQSRFWLKVAGPTFLGAKTNALIESDFYGTGGNNENASLRMRQAWGSLDWANTQVLFGQAYDIFGPAVASTQDFRSGATTGTPNNPRVPQIRLTQKVNFGADNSLKLVLGVQNPVQDFTTAGADGSIPNVAGQVMFVSKALGAAPGYFGLSMNNLTVGAFGLYGTQKVGTGINYHAADVYGYGLYAFVPVVKSKDGKSRTMTASLEAQGYISAGMNWNGANANTPVTSTTDALLTATTPGFRTAAKGYGAYGQLIFYPTQDLGITAGYQRRNALNYFSYRNNGPFEKYNELIYGNIAYDLNAAVRVATEYEHVKTQYSAKVGAGATGDFGQANIVRLCAYYFF